jgi:hypothetical protein
MPEDYIVIVTTDETDDISVPIEGQRGWREEVHKHISSLKEVRLPVSQLEQNMNQFLQLIGRLFKQVDQQIGSGSDMKLDEVELSVEISGEGEVKLVAGGKAAGKGAITLKFTRFRCKEVDGKQLGDRHWHQPISLFATAEVRQAGCGSDERLFAERSQVRSHLFVYR